MTISFIRTLLLYILIIGAVRLMGKRQISEMQTSELVVTLLISDIAAIPMQPWETPYDGQRALKQGTIFPSLDLPFYLTGGGGLHG